MHLTKIAQCAEQTQQLLLQDTEWIERYTEYAKAILANEELIKNTRSSFRIPAGLYAYMPINEAKMQSITFQLRFLGHRVAKAKMTENTILLSTTQKANDLQFEGALKNVAWLSNEAERFRSYFKNYPHDFSNDEREHRYESLILTEMEKTSTKEMFLGSFSKIKPIKIFDCFRFQMPTPLKASGGGLHRSGYFGGGIDILARSGLGNGRRLCICELKPPRITDVQETMEQCVKYAVFIRELLRSSCGELWWKLFGYGGMLPKSINLNCVIVMGIGRREFPVETVEIGEDTFHLHYLYYSEHDNRIRIDATSLDFGN